MHDAIEGLLEVTIFGVIAVHRQSCQKNLRSALKFGMKHFGKDTEKIR